MNCAFPQERDFTYQIPNLSGVEPQEIRKKLGVLLLFSEHLVLCFHRMGTVQFTEGCKGQAELQWHFLQSTEPSGPFSEQDTTNPQDTADITRQRGLSFLTQPNYLMGKTRQLIITVVTPEPGRQAFCMPNPSRSPLQTTYNTFQMHLLRVYLVYMLPWVINLNLAKPFCWWSFWFYPRTRKTAELKD